MRAKSGRSTPERIANFVHSVKALSASTRTAYKPLRQFSYTTPNSLAGAILSRRRHPGDPVRLTHQLLGGVAENTFMAAAIMPATSETLAGTTTVFVVRAISPNCATYCSATRS